MEKPFDEKRIHPRVNVQIGISYSAYSEPMVSFETTLSKGGVFIRSEEPHGVGTELQLGLHLPGEGRPLNATGKVVRVVMPGQGDPCGMGVEILRMPPEDRKILYEYLEGLLREEIKVILVTDDEHLMKMAKRLLEDRGHRVIWIQEWRLIAGIVKKDKVDLVACDIGSTDLDPGVLKTTAAGLPLVIMCDSISPKVRQRAVELGIYEILEKPLDPGQLISLVDTALERRKIEGKAEDILPDLAFEDMSLVAISPAMREVVKQIPKFSHSAQSLLITGKTGTGKRMVANLVQALGPRKDKPFIVVDCTKYSRWNKDMVTSDLFGHERGAFTGADKMKPGLIEEAEGGTWFLDEIGDMHIECQRQLLRVVEEGKFRRLGGNIDLDCNVRVLAATSRNIQSLARKGEFEKGLYYRLNYLQLHLPSLKNRKEDIEALALKYLEKMRKTGKTKMKYISPEVRNQLIEYDWDGNVRELWGVIERSILEHGPECDTLERVLLQPEFDVDDTFPRFVLGDAGAPDTSKTLQEYLEEVNNSSERKYLVECLRQAGGIVREAAKIAGIGRQTFYKKMSKHGITQNDWDIHESL